jgi:hypothetical protein
MIQITWEIVLLEFLLTLVSTLPDERVQQVEFLLVYYLAVQRSSFFSDSLKGQCSEIFTSGFFSLNILPQAPDDLISAILNLLKICEDNRNSKCTTGVNDNPW